MSNTLVVAETNKPVFHVRQPDLDRAIENAVHRAFTYNPRVVWLGGNEYAVGSTSDGGATTYHVIMTPSFLLTGNEDCTCPAGQNFMMCVHKAACYIFRLEREMERDRVGCILTLQPFPAAIELTLAVEEAVAESLYAESPGDNIPRCLSRGCNNPVDSLADCFCTDCALEVAMDYQDVHGF